VAAWFLPLAYQGGAIRRPSVPPVNYATGKKFLRGIVCYEWLEKIIFSREYRVAKEPLGFGSNNSQDPRFC